MKKFDFGQTAQILANLGVIAGLVFALPLCLLSGAAVSQPCAEELDVWSPSGVDHIEVALGGGWLCPSLYWITVDGHLYGMDNRERDHQGRSRPRGVSISIPVGVYEELLALALEARETSRLWYENNFPKYSDHGHQYNRERRLNADGYCAAHEDGIDTSVNLFADGVMLENKCVGGQWEVFQERFFALVNEALEPLANR